MAKQIYHPGIHHKKHHLRFLICLLLITLVGLGVSAYLFKDTWYGDTAVVSSPVYQPSPTPTLAPQSITQTWPVQLTYYQADSYTVVVNKKHKLPNDYAPSDLTSIDGGYLRTAAAHSMQELIDAADSSGFYLRLVSDYRSYADQESIYSGYVAVDGQEQADTYSARPGFSEHQTGLAADVGTANGTCSLMTCFGNTPAGQWLAANGANYGFIVRYPEGKEAVTGYQYEPWHLRYLGISAALGVYNSGLTMDEYFGITAGGY
jgi:D-alanyl-D-alanine carboxypeptidase